MEPKARKCLGISVKKLWWPSTHDAIERGHSLLPVKQQLDYAGRKGRAATMRRGLRFRRPYQQSAHRVASVKRVEQAAHLIPVPNVAALKLRQGHVPAVDVI